MYVFQLATITNDLYICGDLNHICCLITEGFDPWDISKHTEAPYKGTLLGMLIILISKLT
jgi:hypothetical protein